MSSSDEILVSVLDGGRATERGLLQYMNQIGAGLRFSKTGPLLLVGDDVQLEFTRRDGSSPIVVAARVRKRVEEASHRRYGFEFLEDGTWNDILKPQLGEHVERRRGGRYRVLDPIEVTLADNMGGMRFKLPMHDLSYSGVGLRADPEAEVMLLDVDSVQISFELPGLPDRLYFDGILSQRRLVGEDLHYGIDFVALDPATFEEQSNRLEGYLSRCAVRPAGPGQAA